MRSHHRLPREKAYERASHTTPQVCTGVVNDGHMLNNALPTMKISKTRFTLSEEERHLLLGETVLHPYIEKMIREAQKKGTKCTCLLEQRDLIEASDAICHCLADVLDPGKRKGLERLWRRIGTILDDWQ